MTAAGYGDLTAKLVAGSDWMISRQLQEKNRPVKLGWYKQD